MHAALLLQGLLPAHLAAAITLHSVARLGLHPSGTLIALGSLFTLALTALAVVSAHRGRALPWRWAVAGHIFLLAADLGAIVAWLGLRDPIQSLQWNEYGFTDRRWIMILYWGGVFAALIWPLLARWGFEKRPPPKPQLRGYRGDWGGIAWSMTVFLLLAGPPWNLALSTTPMESHELVHLGPIQAALSGKAFYTHTVTQYGPGTLWLILSESVRQFREAWAGIHFVGGLILAACVGLVTPRRWAAWAMLLTCALSPLAHFRFNDLGVLEGIFGWANALRYAPSLAITLAWPWVLLRSKKPWLPSVALGLLWAAGAWMAQENLGNTLAGCGLLTVILFFSGHLLLPRARLALQGVGAGFAIGVMLVLSPFAWRGEAGLFLTRYFGVGGLVARGYSNAAFLGGPWIRAFYLIPLWTLGCAWLGLLSGELALLAPACALIASDANGLLRSDAAHLIVTLSPLGILITTLLADAQKPSWKNSRLALLASLLLILPPSLFAGFNAMGRIHALGRAFGVPHSNPPTGGASSRVDLPYDSESQFQVGRRFKTGEFLTLMDQLHERIGDRLTHVARFPGRSGHVYFFARLRPLTDEPEPTLSQAHSGLEQEALERLSRMTIPCLVWTQPQDPALAIFRSQGAAREEWAFSTSEGEVHAACH